MKKILLLGLFTVALLSMQKGGLNQNPPDDRIKWAKTKHDFGTINEGHQCKAVFKFTNMDTLSIGLLLSQPNYTNFGVICKPIFVTPGKTGELTVFYSTEGHPGIFNKSIALEFTNGFKQILQLRGKVKPKPEKIAWNKTLHNFGTVTEGPPCEVIFKFTNNDTGALWVKSAQTNCGCMNATYTRGKVKPGEMGEVKASYCTSGRQGTFTKNVWVSFDNGMEQVLTVQGTVVADTGTIQKNPIRPDRKQHQILFFRY